MKELTELSTQNSAILTNVRYLHNMLLNERFSQTIMPLIRKLFSEIGQIKFLLLPAYAAGLGGELRRLEQLLHYNT